MSNRSFKTKKLCEVIALTVLAATAGSASAQSAVESKVVDLITIYGTTTNGALRPGDAGTAAALAPVQASLEATQPQSIITRDYISLAVSPIAEYSRIVNVAPSLSGDSANGPALSETKTTMRGFSDDQYNITWDGIPWGDTNNPAHHSTSFFPASTVGGATVERGPGNASNIGYATFGGSINMYSKKASEVQHTELFSSYGTWATRLIGVGYESGRLSSFGDATIQLNLQHLDSDGYLSSSGVKSDNFSLKAERPIGDDSLLTFYSTYNHINYSQPDSNKGATKDQIAAFGRNFQLNQDPTSMNFEGFNHTTKTTDFEYLRLRSDLGSGWKTDNYLYTYAYDNQTTSSTDPKWTGTTLALATYPDPRFTNDANRVKVNGHIPGIDKQNQYRVYGGIFNLSYTSSFGTAKAGIWYERSDTDRHQYDLDLTNGSFNRVEKTVNASFLPGTSRFIDSVLFDQQSNISNFQPFVEFAWNATDALTVTPGLKQIDITRDVNAPVEQTTRELNHIKSVDYSTTLPFLTANYRISDGMSIYAQYAKGFQIPDLKTFYIAKPEQNSDEPQLSTNYQVGIVSRNDKLLWDVDFYRIEFINKLVSNGLTGDAAAFINIGGATYKGIEGQIAYVIGNGFSVSANGSVNSAIANDTGAQISGAPIGTLALGGLYSQGPWAVSLNYKKTASTFQKDLVCGATCNNAYFSFYQTPAYDTVDIGIVYSMDKTEWTRVPIKLQLHVFNLLDNDKVTSISTGSSTVMDDKRDTFIFQAPRSVIFTIKTQF